MPHIAIDTTLMTPDICVCQYVNKDLRLMYV